MAAGGQFGPFWMIENHFRSHFSPFQINTHRILVIWDLNGNGEYEFEWCIDDKVMACTSVGVRRRRRRRRNQKDNITEIFKFREYNKTSDHVSREKIRSHFSPFQINTQLFVQNGHQRKFWKSDFPKKTIGFFPYVLSMPMPNMIGEFMTELENPQAF